MTESAQKAVAIVGVGAVLPDAPDAPTFWENVKNGRYSISEVTPDRWKPEDYFDPDPSAPDKTYSKIGGWVRDWTWDPLKWKLPIPPKVSDTMDRTQKWALIGAREALRDYGYPERRLDPDRTAVILGNAMAGEFHYITAIRIFFPEYAEELASAPTFSALSEKARRAIAEEFRSGVSRRFPPITEDTMPGELANIIAGRVANIFNFHGPNYVVDAACASAMAAMTAAVEGLEEGDYDAVVTGGIDSNMGPTTFTKFSKIGALSATGTRPYADGADGFVMGEGAAIFLLKRLADAERDQDRIYAVLRGFGGSSDGKGKGITAPNPIGQKFAVGRAWRRAGIRPDAATLIEGHGTSTKVGDVVEVEGLTETFQEFGLQPGSVPLGSVKSNIGHLKGAAGAAGILKAAFALRDKALPPSLNFDRPNPNIDFAHSPFFVNRELRPWEVSEGRVRTAGVSAFGFGGTNFHAVLEEHVPGRLTSNRKATVAVGAEVGRHSGGLPASPSAKAPLRGALVLGADSEPELRRRLKEVRDRAAAGQAPPPGAPSAEDLAAPARLSIDYGDAAELADKASRALKAIDANHPGMWKALRAQGIFRGAGPAPKVAFLYTGQGSQYVNMLAELRRREPIVARCFEEADAKMTPLLGGKSLSSFIFVDGDDPAALAEAEEALRQTAITQPAVLAADRALTMLLDAYGIRPDMVMGHSLGEYGALVAAGALPFPDALEAVSARGREMTRVSVADTGKMAAVFASMDEIERILKTIDGYVVVANVNSNSQAVVGGASEAVEKAIVAFQKAGYDARRIPVSHAFHTSIVSPASGPLREVLERLDLRSPKIPIAANISGQFYPMGNGVVPEMLDILAKQVASPVQFVQGLRTLYDAGARVFVETGPKKALFGFVEDVLGDREDVSALFTNHPKLGDLTSFNQALCGLYAAGLGAGVARESKSEAPRMEAAVVSRPAQAPIEVRPQPPVQPRKSYLWGPLEAVGADQRYYELGRLFADFLEKGQKIYSGGSPSATDTPVVISGAAMGLPGTDRVFDDLNLDRMMRGEQFIDVIPSRFRKAMVDKHVTRLVKSDQGGPRFEVIESPSEAIKLAGRAGRLDLVEEFGFPAERMPALDIVTQLAIAAGIDALRDAGIPLVMRYKTTTRNTQLPDRWCLPEEMQDDTGVIFASAFPGMDSFAQDQAGFFRDQALRQRLEDLSALQSRLSPAESRGSVGREIERRIAELKAEIERDGYSLDRRFLFRALAMGHSQFAEYICARGPNTQVNAACASTTQAVTIADDWIRAGRCRRVVVIAADNVTSDHLIEWIGAGFLATGAAATDELVEEAALPFDRRRHGMILGMGAAALVVESAESVRRRGLLPICEVLGSVTANSAFHGTRLDVGHICGVMEDMVSQAERRWGVDRRQMAPETLFVSHETYTPARGGSAQAEVDALRHVFGGDADQIVVANTKGFTGHAMGAGIEDVLAVKALETGMAPPVANFKEVDPELGRLNLSRGGSYPIRYALRLGAGFGSQISMTLYRHVATPDGRRPSPRDLGYHHRQADPVAWNAFLARVAGRPSAEVEVHRRTLRVKDQGAAPARTAEVRASATPPAAAPVPPPAAAPTPPPVSASPVATESKPPRPAGDPVRDRVLSLVAEVTGYPPDMLDMELDLEADLGIDTVKQAEMFASIRQEYDIPRDDSLKLREFPTLNHVLKFVRDRRPDLASVPAAAPAGTAVAEAAPSAVARLENAVQSQVMEIVSGVTGYPSEMLDLDLDLEADLGIDTVKQAETFASIREAFGIERDENLQLRQFPTLKHVLQFVYDRRPDLKTSEAAAAAPASPQPVVAAAPPPAADQADPVRTKVLDIVAQVTGYPGDMLDLELDLEADLGIDTVKQAETFASIREAFAIPREENLQLREFPTLNHVLRFVYDRRPDLVAAAPTPAASIKPKTAAAPQPAAADEVTGKVLSIVSQVTGYPSDMLDLELDLEADLGIDTVKQAETFASVRQAFGIPRDENLQLRDFPTLRHVLKFVYDKKPELRAPAPQPVAAVEAPAADSGVATGEVEQKVLGIVAEVTGYPPEMLDLELDLEADLGIDTVKQAETFASIRQAFDIQRDENLQLREFPTLRRVLEFVYQKRPDLRTAQARIDAPVAAPAAPDAPLEPPVAPASFEEAAKIAHRVAVSRLRPQLKHFQSTGVELDSSSRVLVMLDQGGVGKALVGRLEKLGVTVLAVEDAPEADELASRIEEWLSQGPIQGVYWLPALDSEGSLWEIPDLAAWREALRVRVKLLYTAMRTLYAGFDQAGTFLVSATRLGGRHGYDEHGAVSPLGGPVAGFTKAFKRERGASLVKVVDFEASRKTAAFADLLIDETLRDPGVVEIGYQDDQRWTVALQEQAVDDGRPALPLGPETVFVVTGAAGSIVSAIVADLAAASGGVFHLFDLTPEPDPENSDLARLGRDREGLKRDLFERIKARGERATPALVEKELAALERSKAALDAIRSVRRAGGQAHYRSVDLTRPEAVAEAMRHVRQTSGRVDVLLHAAGLEISRFLPDKSPAEFNLVFDVKSDGWFNLLHSMGDMPLGATVVFSSIAGRFGNGGQTDYSSANDLLCKTTSSFRNTRPEVRGVAIDWTAWSGIGMASRGSIPKMMEVAGIDMLAPEAGIPIIRRILTQGGWRGEVVIGGRLGILMEEFAAAGGLDLAQLADPTGPMAAVVSGMGPCSGLTVEVTLDPSKQPFLDHHRIDGTPVLPGVMGIEAFAEATRTLFPEWRAEAVEDVHFLAPFKFYRDESRTVTVNALFDRQGESLVADCQLTGSRTLPNQSEPQRTVHFTARVRLSRRDAEEMEAERPPRPDGPEVGADAIYQVYFHGPAYQVLEKAWKADGRVIGQMPGNLPADQGPSRLPTVMSPRLIELCFQTAGIWEMGTTGKMGLPLHVERVRALRSPDRAEGPFYAIVTPQPDGYSAQVVDGQGEVYLSLNGYRTVELPGGVEEARLEPLRAAMS